MLDAKSLTIPVFTPERWYWRSDAGLVYSSAAHTKVPKDDGDYQAWLAAGNTATVWPRDADGKQTQAELDATLAQLGVGVPDVSSAQAKIMLSRAGYLDAVKATVSAIGGEVEIWFTDARTWQRANPHVSAVGDSLNLTSNQIDELFREAAQIDA